MLHKKYIKMALMAISLAAILAAGLAGAAFATRTSQTATATPTPPGQPVLPETGWKAESFPTASAAICPQSPTTGANAAASIDWPAKSPSPADVAAGKAPPDKRTSALSTCYYQPAVTQSPTSCTIAVGQTCTFSLTVYYAEYGCDTNWAGHLATINGSYSNTFTVGPFGATGTYTYSTSCGGYGGTNGTSTTVTVVSSGGGGGGGSGNPCTENSTSQLYATFRPMAPGRPSLSPAPSRRNRPAQPRPHRLPQPRRPLSPARRRAVRCY
jgi:plastocyanin